MINSFNQYFCLCGSFLFNERDNDYDFECENFESYFLFHPSKITCVILIGDLICCKHCEFSLGEAVWDSEEYPITYILKIWKESIERIENINYY